MNALADRLPLLSTAMVYRAPLGACTKTLAMFCLISLPNCMGVPTHTCLLTISSLTVTITGPLVLGLPEK